LLIVLGDFIARRRETHGIGFEGSEGWRHTDECGGHWIEKVVIETSEYRVWVPEREAHFVLVVCCDAVWLEENGTR
jgi:hypothetical protein